MMPTIRVDQDVFEGLQKLAQPFVDSPSTVIRRMLEERGVLVRNADAPGPSTPKVRIFSKNPAPVSADRLTPQSFYENYLLVTLLKEFNSKGHKRDVTHSIVKRMMKDGHIGPADQELVATGETKAENTIAWARNALKDRGHISRISPRGIWELTAEGKDAASRVALPKPG